ncbi:MAG: hypothetical protein IKG46_09445 [Solobacterium sp.]|nr:hypothetical protein [Solobacterium sp.]
MNGYEHQETLMNMLSVLQEKLCFVRKVTAEEDRAVIRVHADTDLTLTIPYDAWEQKAERCTPGQLCPHLMDFIIFSILRHRELPYGDHTIAYEEIRRYLVIRPLNADKERERLQDAVCRYFWDIALVLYCEIPSDDGQYISFLVTRHLYSTWNISPRQLYEDALANTAGKYPPRMFVDLIGLIDRDEGGIDVMAVNTVLPYPCAIPLITTANVSSNGAVAMFYPGVLKKLSGIMQGDYFIVFTGISEARLHDPAVFHPQEALEALKETNADFPETLLSRNVYYFDADTGLLGVYASPDS